MAPRTHRPSAAERNTGLAVLALLVAVAVWLAIRQADFNPAVNAALKAAAPGPSAPASSLARYLPGPPGAAPTGPAEGYGPADLSDKINGKAELYLPAGFREMACRRYRLASGVGVEVFLYDMGSPEGAFAVFSGQRRPGAEGLDLTGQAYVSANALFLVRGRFYAEFVAEAAAPEVRSNLKAMATELLRQLPAEAGAGPDASALFPAEGLQADSVRLNAADVFGLEGFANVHTAEYRLPAGQATAFLALRDNPDLAREDNRRYLAFLTANGYRDVPEAAPKGVRLLALDGSYEAVFLAGPALAGVHDAPTAELARDLSARLVRALQEKSR